ncbi:GDSL-type esterase/lipase family protein [Granulicella mallensis]|uniref:Curculin domain protein (Mannose-binding) lectin n=1 Tax=Granulicella mallensis (strain ATCC BAA-1857 / DSM 23137 / MP5ACTX8) TaxID=682795 RepID=G8P176_GRAMM|nr:GDSL-type esterase/lipase family protein [Granulicella mallensis]AEU38094.1 Curculin domain protein (mannose-binding) lectin [Granulicella mallensis MP5ACTX8]
MNIKKYSAGAILFLSLGMISAAHAQSSVPWTGTWAVAPQQSTIDASFNGLAQQTLRQILHTSIGGSAARVQISNTFGQQPLTVRDVHLAQAVVDSNGGPTSSTIPGTDHVVTFGGFTSVTVPAGQTLASDSIAFVTTPQEDLMVSMYFPTAVDSANVTFHQNGNQNGMFLAAGDVSGSSTINTTSAFSSYFYLTNVDVQNAASPGAVVAIGASITDGLNSTFNTNHRWTNDLSARLNTAGLPIGVINEGISGNDLLRDGAGQAMITRFSRDVLSQPNVKWVIVSDDIINDLSNLPSDQEPSFNSLVAGVQQIMSQGHAAGIKFYCSTLTPNGGRPAAQWSTGAEAIREQINAFFLSPTSGCDGIVDQDTATHDPNMPLQYRASFDSGDHLHPNDAGHQAIANAVNLGLFVPTGIPPIKAPTTSCTALLTGEGLIPDHPLVSCDGRFMLYLQDDGNLVLYFGNTPLWSSGTVGHIPSEATLLADGNFVLYDNNGKVLFQSNTAGLLGQVLDMQNDGNLVLYNGTTATASPVFDTNTCCR